MVSEAEQRTHYNRIAEEYDGRHNLGLGRDNRNHRKKWRLLRKAIGGAPGDRLLEVGCGTGLHARLWEREFDYTGVDISSEMVAGANRRLDTGVARVANAQSLPFNDGSFDAVVGTAALHHMPDVEESLTEWGRVTSPGGVIALVEPNWLFPKDFIRALFDTTERGALRMRKRNLRRIIDTLKIDDYTVTNEIYTPPWPTAAHGLFDRIDDIAAQIPGVRNLSIQLLITIRV